MFNSVLTSFGFLLLNVALLLIVLYLNRHTGGKVKRPSAPQPEPTTVVSKPFDAGDILDWEFNYARTTASEAMQDRHTMINFYLVVVGVVASGVVASLGERTLSVRLGTLLLWLLTAIGWFYFLKIIRFRQAWHDSARAMNQIKEFIIEHNKDLPPEELRRAFIWQAATLPSPDKPWTVFFFSGMLVAFINSLAFVGGGVLYDVTAVVRSPVLVGGALLLLGAALFGFHVWLYFAFLAERPRQKST